MDVEILSIDKKIQTWTIVDLPLGKTPVCCKWIHKIKYHANGSIDRHNSILVAKGNIQIEGG